MRVRAAAPPLRRRVCTEHLTPIPSPPSDLKRGLVSSSEAPFGRLLHRGVRHGAPLPAWLRGPSFHSRRLRTPPASSVPSPRIHRPGWWPSQRLPWSPGDPRAGVNVRCSAPKPLEGHSGTPSGWSVCTFTPQGLHAAPPLPHPVSQPSASLPLKWV